MESRQVADHVRRLRPAVELLPTTSLDTEGAESCRQLQLTALSFVPRVQTLRLPFLEPRFAIFSSRAAISFRASSSVQSETP